MENVGNILSYFNEELNNVSNQREITSWAYISIKHILGLNRSQCIIHNKRKISKNISLEEIKNELINSEKTKILNMHSISHYDKVFRTISIKLFQ